jgi:hypothetical protein
MLPTLREFLDHPLTRNGYVRARGFHHLYVRKGERYVEGVWYNRVIDLANFEVNHPGRGLFGRFIARLRNSRPEWGLYVESVLNPRLPRRLMELGFKPVAYTNPPSFWLPARSK